MIEFWFTRRFNFFDTFFLAIATSLLLHHHWLLGALLCVAGALPSAAGEIALTRKGKPLAKPGKPSPTEWR